MFLKVLDDDDDLMGDCINQHTSASICLGLWCASGPLRFTLYMLNSTPHSTQFTASDFSDLSDFHLVLPMDYNFNCDLT